MLWEEPADAWAQGACSHSGRPLTRLSALARVRTLPRRVPQLSSSGMPEKPAGATTTSTCSQLDNGVFIPTFLKVLDPWVRVWLLPKEEWTRCRFGLLGVERGFGKPPVSWMGCSDGDLGKVFGAATQRSERAPYGCAFMDPQLEQRCARGPDDSGRKAVSLTPLLPVRG